MPTVSIVTVSLYDYYLLVFLCVYFLYCFACRPVIITDVVRSWKAMNWTKSFLVSNYGDKRVSMKATKVRWTVIYYICTFMCCILKLAPSLAKLIFKINIQPSSKVTFCTLWQPDKWMEHGNRQLVLKCTVANSQNNTLLNNGLTVCVLDLSGLGSRTWVVWAPVLAGVIILCSWARYFVLTVPHSAQGLNKNGYWLVIKYVC